MQKGLIKYIVIIGIILGIAFLSQFMKSNEYTKNFADNATGQLQKYAASGSNWLASNVYPAIGGGVQNGGEAIKSNIEQAKKVPENILTNAENYFSGIANSILHPGENNSNACSTPATSSTQSN